MATPQYDDEAQVLLFDCGHDPSTAFTDRRLFLTKGNPTVAIGRTSKRDATLEQAQSNAWIDSAVMSRHHAKLELDVANKQVLITDVGSLHGTYLNGVLLTPNMPQPLAQDDMLRFGIAVVRSTQSFPPCTMRVLFKFGTEQRPEGRPAVFRVPDDSDYEDDTSDDDDDDPSILNTAATMLSRGFRPSVTVKTFRSERGEVIDLTEANPGDLEDDEYVPEHGPPSTVPGATSATTAAHNELIHEADVPGSDPHSPWQDREDSPLPEPHQTDVDALDELHDSASMSESADEDDLDLDTPSEVDLSHDLHSSELEDSSASHDSPECGCDDMAPGKPEPPIAERGPLEFGAKGFSSQDLEAAQSLEEDDYMPATAYSTIGLSSQECLSSQDLEAAQNLEEEDYMPATESDANGLSSLGLPAAQDLKVVDYMPATLPLSDMSLPPLGMSLPVPDHIHLPPIACNVRETTMHAMDRSTQAFDSGLAKFITPPQSGRVRRLHPLSLHQPVPRPGQTWNSEDVEPSHGLGQSPLTPAFAAAAGNSCDGGPTSGLLASGAKFLTTPPTGDEPKHTIPSPVDDTSAYAFEQSKKAAAVDEASSRRTHVAINDLLEADGERSKNVPKDQPARKRKLADLSSTTPEEEHSAVTAVQQPGKPDAERPAKRLRKAAEVFGYVALGGVAVMSALIATAPNL